MQKIESKFLVLVISLIVIIIIITAYISLFMKGVDRNSYVELINGVAYLNDKELELKQREKLNINDEIKTNGTGTLAVIEWGDGSVTRLGGNTSIIINDLFVSDTKDKINISFKLLNGKTWSNVVSFIPEGSYFLESFMDLEAAVRGTIFNVDLEKDYLYVIESLVEIKDSSGAKVLVEEKKPIELSTLKFIRLEEFINKFKDTSFDTLNRILDTEMYKILQEKVTKTIKDISKYTTLKVDELTDVEKNKLYKELLGKYQDFNFANTDNNELYEKKILIKEKLIQLAPKEDKVLFLDSMVQDFKNVINIKDYEVINDFVRIFKENTDNLTNSGKQIINEYLGELELIQGIKDAFKNNISDLKKVFNITKQ